MSVIWCGPVVFYFPFVIVFISGHASLHRLGRSLFEGIGNVPTPRQFCIDAESSLADIWDSVFVRRHLRTHRTLSCKWSLWACLLAWSSRRRPLLFIPRASLFSTLCSLVPRSTVLRFSVCLMSLSSSLNIIVADNSSDICFVHADVPGMRSISLGFSWPYWF